MFGFRMARVCYCKMGYYGKDCGKESVLREHIKSQNGYIMQELSDNLSLYWRKVEDKQEIEIALRNFIHFFFKQCNLCQKLKLYNPHLSWQLQYFKLRLCHLTEFISRSPTLDCKDLWIKKIRVCGKDSNQILKIEKLIFPKIPKLNLFLIWFNLNDLEERRRIMLRLGGDLLIQPSSVNPSSLVWSTWRTLPITPQREISMRWTALIL